MSDDENNAVESPKPKKGHGLGIVLAVVITASTVATGMLVAPKLLATHKSPAAKASGEPEDAPVNPTVAFQPIVVDVRASGEEMHHLKVTLTFELSDGTKPEDFEKYVPRGREAAIAYLRSQSFDAVTRPDKFGDISRELTDRVVEAVGRKRIRRMMITDFVTQ